jgi:hypothetical protein
MDRLSAQRLAYQIKLGLLKAEKEKVLGMMPVPTPTPPVTPDVFTPQLIAQMQAKLLQETARADAAEKKAADEAQLKEEWKVIADKEKARGDKLEEANKNRQEESTELRASRDLLRTSVNEYKEEVKDLRRDLERARSAQKWWGAGGLVLGFGVCRAVDR